MTLEVELTAPSIPIALDQAARRLLVALGRQATYRTVCALFGEDPETWNAFVNQRLDHSIDKVDTWLWHWRQSGMPNIVLRQLRRGQISVQTTEARTALHLFRSPPEPEPAHHSTTIDTLEFLGKGSSRTVYLLDEETVVKIPNGAHGEKVNAIEARMYTEEVERLERNGIPASDCGLAKCWLGKLNEDDVSEVLFMEYVKKSRSQRNRKHLRHVDRGQVGHNKAGRLVKFDYGG